MTRIFVTAGLLTGVVFVASAQQRPSFTPLAVGTEAPAFVLKGATKDGPLPKEVSLLDFRGQTVVLAFFYKARTGG